MRRLPKRLKVAKLKTKELESKVMLCQERYQHTENIIVLGDSSNNEDENDDEKTNNSFKLKLSSSSSLSSHSSTLSSTSTNRVSTRQSLKTQSSNNKEALKNSSDTSSDLIIENGEKNQQLDESVVIKKCLWHRCSYNTSKDNEFMDHIQSKHVYSQKNCKKFRCLWKNCRVYKSQSSSFNWLERHVITHVDTKPFLCILNGCKRKFPTQTSLERHVNTHMKIYESPSKQQKLLNQQISTTSTSLSSDSIKNASVGNGNGGYYHQSKVSSSNYTTGRKRKLIEASKYLKKAKYKDYFDECACKYIEQHLVNMNYNNGILKLKANVSSMLFKAQMITSFFFYF